MRTIVPLSEYGSGTTAATPTSDRGGDMAAAIGVCTQHGQHGGTTKSIRTGPLVTAGGPEDTGVTAKLNGTDRSQKKGGNSYAR